MKKFFFFLTALLTVCLTNSYAQLAPRAITCLSADALHPIAGQSYTYSITVPTPASGTKNVLWYVTQDQNFINAGNLTDAASREAVNGKLLAAATTGYNVSTADLTSMDLTWKSIAYNSAQPIFVVINVINDDGTCTPNNLKVYEIVPVNAFTLDIANINGGTTQSGYGTNINLCISNIVSAKYNTTEKKIEYDYGTNTLYYEVVAANWSGQWKPSVQLSGIDPNETVTVEWSTTNNFAAGTVHTMTGSAVGTGATKTEYTSTDNVSTSSNSVGSAGESIFIRVTLDHTTPSLMYEGLTDEKIDLAIDGELYAETAPGTWASTSLHDVHYNNGTTPTCTPLAADGYDNDIATQTVKARPDVTASTPTPFLTGIPKP